MYQGGLYKHEQIVELVEDLGGYIIQKNNLQTDMVILMLVPEEDMPIVEAKAKELLGKLTKSPLAGSEVAVVTPTLAYQHLPHLACDVAEYLRRNGAKTNMIGLARGVGKRVAQLKASEIDLINEHDIAVFLFGNFEECIKQKSKLFVDIDVPVVVAGGPQMDSNAVPNCSSYIGGLGRLMHRLKRKEEMETMDRLVNVLGDLLDERRRDLDKDPLSISPQRIMNEIDKQLPDIHDSLAPAPITLNLNGARIKLPYTEYADDIRNLKLEEGICLKEVADVKSSKMRDYILIRIKPKSETGFVI